GNILTKNIYDILVNIFFYYLDQLPQYNKEFIKLDYKLKQYKINKNYYYKESLFNYNNYLLKIKNHPISLHINYYYFIYLKNNPYKKNSIESLIYSNYDKFIE